MNRTEREPLVPVRLRVNGEDRAIRVPPYRLLLDCLRNDLGLTGTKEGCGVGVCGACTVLLDGRMVSSCILLAVMAEGAEITTVEGLARGGRLHAVQQAFVDHGGFQCGICTPGQVVAAKALVDENPVPTEADIKEWMMGNLCRCTGYYQIVESILKAAATNAATGTRAAGPKAAGRPGTTGAVAASRRGAGRRPGGGALAGRPGPRRAAKRRTGQKQRRP